MKKTTLFITLLLVLVMSLSAIACSSNSTATNTTAPAAATEAPKAEPATEPEATAAVEEDDDSFSYAGTYTYEEDGIVYEMLVLANTDYEMSVTKDFGTYKAVKYYLGPLKDIDGNRMAQMPVFLGDFYYVGDGAPSQEEAEALLDQLSGLFQAAKAELGEGEEPKFFYITLDKDNWTFTPDTATNEAKGLKSSLDYISTIWTAEDVEAAAK